MNLKNQIKMYQNQPFAIRYKPEDIIREGSNRLKTKDGKYQAYPDGKGFSYWHGEDCYPNISYGYFFIFRGCSLAQAAENLNKTLDPDYEFNPNHQKFK